MKENLDLKLTPYKVLATSGNHGQFVSCLHVPVISDTWSFLCNINCYWILKIQSLSNIVSLLAGFVQFIESTPVAEVLDKDEDKSIQVWEYLLCLMRDFLLVTFYPSNTVIYFFLCRTIFADTLHVKVHPLESVPRWWILMWRVVVSFITQSCCWQIVKGPWGLTFEC